MKRHRVDKSITKSVLRKLRGKKPNKAVRSLEKKVRTTLLEHARALSEEINSVAVDLVALPSKMCEDWLWLGDIKRAGYMMEQVIEMLEGTKLEGTEKDVSPIFIPVHDEHSNKPRSSDKPSSSDSEAVPSIHTQL